MNELSEARHIAAKLRRALGRAEAYARGVRCVEALERAARDAEIHNPFPWEYVATETTGGECEY